MRLLICDGAVTPPLAHDLMSVARYVFDTSDWDNLAWISPLGACGHPGSPHYADQTSMWAEGDLVPMLYSWDRLAADAESRKTLHPA